MEIRTHKEVLSAYKVHIRSKLHEIKEEMKLREEKLEKKENEVTDVAKHK